MSRQWWYNLYTVCLVPWYHKGATQYDSVGTFTKKHHAGSTSYASGFKMVHQWKALDIKVTSEDNSRAWQTDGQTDLGTAGQGPRPTSEWTERLASAWPKRPVTLRHGERKEVWGQKEGTVEGETRKSWVGGQEEQQCSKKEGVCGLWLLPGHLSV